MKMGQGAVEGTGHEKIIHKGLVDSEDWKREFFFIFHLFNHLFIYRISFELGHQIGKD